MSNVDTDDLSPFEAEHEDDAPAAPVGFTIHDDETASWVVNKLLACEEEITRVKVQAKTIVARAEDRRKRLEERFGEELRAYAAARLEGGKSRTLHLLHGSCSFRRIPGGPRVVDRDATLAWASEALKSAVRFEVVEHLDVDAVKEHVAQTGELPPGVELREASDSFSVRFPK